jgi:hypothetical protein
MTSPTRRSVLIASAAAAASICFLRTSLQRLVDLRRRIAATRWPDRETVADRSQGVQLAKLQELVRYWGTDYDWRKARRSSTPCRSS